MQSIVIVGGSLAGLSAARAARAAGFAGELMVIGAESDRPYDRPPLSKEFLAGQIEDSATCLEAPTEQLGVDWRLGASAVRLDPAEPVVSTADGATHRGDGIVLATGGSPVVPLELATAAEGCRPSNLTALRTLADARWLRDRLRPGTNLVVIGAGLIGSEVAATATGLGCRVSVVDIEPDPLRRLYGADLAQPLADLHARHGVDLVYGAKVSDVELRGDRVESLVLDDGRNLSADVVLVAIGARPAVGWLADSGLEIGDGVICDAAGRTSRDGVVAVGDCAAWYDRHFERPHRAQHWTDALERPAVAVGSLLGVPYVPRRPFLPYFWSDQYGLKIQMAGYASLADEVRIESGDPADGPFLAVYRRAGEPVAVLGISTPREFTRWRKVITTALAGVAVETVPSPVAAPASAAPTDVQEHR